MGGNLAGDGAASEETQARLMASARRWYSPGEIARVLGVDRRSVTRWIRQGKLEAERPHPNKRYAKVTPEQLAEAARRGTIPALTVGWMRNQRARVSGTDIGNDGASAGKPER